MSHVEPGIGIGLGCDGAFGSSVMSALKVGLVECGSELSLPAEVGVDALGITVLSMSVHGVSRVRDSKYVDESVWACGESVWSEEPG